MIRIISTGLAMLVLALPTTSLGQQVSDGVAEGRAMVKAGREELVRSELQLTAEEEAAFWPIFMEYQAISSSIMDRYTALLTDFVDRWERSDMSNEYAADLLDKYFGIKQELLTVQKHYVPKFKAVLPALKVAQFFQIENKIRAEIDSQLAIAIPLIDPT